MWRWVDHTAELELEIEADSAEAVFADATGALAELLGGGEARGTTLVRMLAVEAPDRAALLAAFIEELVFLAESESLVPTELLRLVLARGAARADVAVVAAEPPHLVKAVTYHRLEFEPAHGGYRARVVLDV